MRHLMAHLQHIQQQAAAQAAAAAAETQRANELAAQIAARQEADRKLAAEAAAMPASPVCSLADMRAKLSAWRPGRGSGRKLRVPRANIGILGVRGCGKSSFLNAVMSAALGEMIKPARVAPGDDHVTRELFHFDAFDGARLFDLWGWTENYNLDALLLAMLTRVSEIIRALQKSRVPVFVLLTKSDTAIGPNGVAPDLANFYESALLHAARQSLAETLKIEKDCVLAVSAPVGIERPELSNATRDRCMSICLTALDAVLRDVNTFYDNVADGRVKRNNAPLFPIEATPAFEATNGKLWLAEGQDLAPTSYRAIDLDETAMSCRIQLKLDNAEYECVARASAALVSSLVEILFDVRDRERVTCIANGCIALANPVAMTRVRR
jgi:hypothetical protein